METKEIGLDTKTREGNRKLGEYMGFYFRQPDKFADDKVAVEIMDEQYLNIFSCEGFGESRNPNLKKKRETRIMGNTMSRPTVDWTYEENLEFADSWDWLIPVYQKFMRWWNVEFKDVSSLPTWHYDFLSGITNENRAKSWEAMVDAVEWLKEYKK